MKRCRNDELWDFEHEILGGDDIILGIDGGTTSTVCVCIGLSDPRVVSPSMSCPMLARVVGGCSNHNSVGETAARETLEQVMAEALSKSGSIRSSVRAVCLAVSGVNHPTDQQRILDWLSGYGIAAQALTAIIRAHDGRGPHTKLTYSILKTLDLSSPDELIGWTYADPSWARIAALVPVVVACAEAGDEVANNILLDSVEELALSVRAVIQRLGLAGEDGQEAFPLVMVGGVLEAKRRWDIAKKVINSISKEYPGILPVWPKVEPALGAALLAWNFLSKDYQQEGI